MLNLMLKKCVKTYFDLKFVKNKKKIIKEIIKEKSYASNNYAVINDLH